MKITINMDDCTQCRHLSHSGSFTIGGAKNVCDHDGSLLEKDVLKINLKNCIPNTEKWYVRKYFDTYPEEIIRTNLTKEEAEEIANKLNTNTNYLVEYIARSE